MSYDVDDPRIDVEPDIRAGGDLAHIKDDEGIVHRVTAAWSRDSRAARMTACRVLRYHGDGRGPYWFTDLDVTCLPCLGTDP